MLHANELYLREVFIKCDGGLGTTGPTSFAGPLGQQCKEDLHLLPVKNFAPILTEVEEITMELEHDLSWDQKLLYSYCISISEGEISAALARQAIGPVNHSR